MNLKTQDTHHAEYPMSGVLRQSYPPYLSSILQDRAISYKMVKLVKKMVHVLLVWLGILDRLG